MWKMQLNWYLHCFKHLSIANLEKNKCLKFISSSTCALQKKQISVACLRRVQSFRWQYRKSVCLCRLYVLVGRDIQWKRNRANYIVVPSISIWNRPTLLFHSLPRPPPGQFSPETGGGRRGRVRRGRGVGLLVLVISAWAWGEHLPQPGDSASKKCTKDGGHWVSLCWKRELHTQQMRKLEQIALCGWIGLENLYVLIYVQINVEINTCRNIHTL